MPSSSSPVSVEPPYDPWGKVGFLGKRVGPVYGSPSSYDDCESGPGECDFGDYYPCVEEKPCDIGDPSSLCYEPPVPPQGPPDGEGNPAGGQPPIPSNPFGGIPDTTPRRPAGVGKANTLGGEAAMVREGIGQLHMVEVDIGSDAGWGQTRSYANIEGPDEGGLNGNRWLNKELAYLDFEGAAAGINAPNRVIRRSLANESLWFDKDPMSGNYAPVTAFVGNLTHGNGEFSYTDASYNQWVYYDNSLSHASSLRGRLKRVIPSVGANIVASYDSNDELERVARTEDDFGGQYAEYDYEYYDTLEHVGMLKSVTRSWYDSSFQLTPDKKVEYFYYGTDEAGGSVNDLKQVSVYGYYVYGGDGYEEATEGVVGELVEEYQNFYRYYKPVPPNDPPVPGFVHGLKYALRPSACQRIQADGLNPSAVSDEVLATYADYYFEYDDDRRVTKQVIRGGEEFFLYDYAVNPDAPSGSETNTWSVCSTITHPDGNTRVVYSNPTVSTIVAIFKDADGNETAEAMARNATGWESQYAYPSAIGSVTQPSGGSTALTVNYNADDGLIYKYDYYSSDDPGTGAVKGWPMNKSSQKGSGGTADLLSEASWSSHTAEGVTAHSLRKQTKYIVSGMTSPPAQEVINTYYQDAQGNDTLTIQKQVIKLQVIPISENGDGQAYETEEHFDSNGRNIWYRDAAGFITHWQYRDDGALTKRVDDVNTALFNEVPTGWATPIGGGLNIVMDIENDTLGRPVRTYGPWHSAIVDDAGTQALNVRTVKFNVYRDDVDETWSALGYATGDPAAYGFETVGPVMITRRDKQKRVTEVIKANRECTCGALKTIESFPQKSWTSREQTFYDDWGRIIQQRNYHKLPLYGEGEREEHYYETKTSYDDMGRRVRQVSADGTITRSVKDARGYTVSRWTGTDDSEATAGSPTGGTSGRAAGNNMEKTLELDYDDGSATGNGLLTKEARLVDGNTENNRITHISYDYRGFLEEQKQVLKQASGNTDFIVRYSHNNVGQIVQVDNYHTAVDPENLTGRQKFHHDCIGRIYKSEIFGVSPLNGTVGNFIYSEQWRDSRGNVVKGKRAGGESFTKSVFDGINRLTASYLCVNSGTSSNDNDVSSDTIIEQSELIYNSVSNLIKSMNSQRFHDANGTGKLNGPNGSEPRARRSYIASWQDGINRERANVDVGTNGGAEWARPVAVPERSSTVLVNSTCYARAGYPNVSIDANGTETHWENDAMGRMTLLMENVDTEAAADDYGANRITAYSYNSNGQLRTLTLVNQVTGDQVTRWVYGTTLKDSEIASNSLLRGKIFPESNDENDPLGDGPEGIYERIEYEYNRQGAVRKMTDPNRTVHAYEYDSLGRQTQDRVTAFGEGIDTVVKRIETIYDAKRQLVSQVRSFDDAVVGSGSVINELAYVYNGFGQLTEDIQSHSGASNASSPRVKYGYADGSQQSNTIRRTGMTYPNGRQIDYSYLSVDGKDNLLSRMASFQIHGEGFDLCRYTYMGAARYVNIAFSQPSVELSYKRASESSVGDAGDPYCGYDRFGRTVDMRWVNSSDEEDVKDRVQYGYDPTGSRTWRRNLAAPNGGQDFSYRYDGLHQVAESNLGTLNINQTAVGGIPAKEEKFDYDPTGNWLNHQEAEQGINTLGQTRVNNKDNQMSQLDDSSIGIAYDLAGNATKAPPNAAGDWSEFYQLKWDGWNRIVEVKNSVGGLVAAYSYDATFRRITRTVAGNVEHSYYNSQWKVIEERDNESTSAKLQYVWGERSGHRDELILRDRDTSGNGSLDERLYGLMEYYNLTSMVDTSGDVVERYRFSAFGNRTVMESEWIERASSAFEVSFGFQGQFEDEETGYYNYGFRYYMPEAGRWASRDPIGEQGGVNLYLFVSNNAVGKVDLFGLSCADDGPPFWSLSTGAWGLTIDPVVQGNGGRGNTNIAVDSVNFRWTTVATIKCKCDEVICYRSGVREVTENFLVPNDEETWSKFNPMAAGGLPFYSPSSMTGAATDAAGAVIDSATTNLAKPYVPSLAFAGVINSFIKKHWPKKVTEGRWVGGSPCDR